ncbi:MAG: hypothetical protein BGO69_00605 [Bacteroidetes bacterium 46-16]|nr:MAG: hypothetical protein BGO69_00605 [Bacteroidetes bacterium 46-16]
MITLDSVKEKNFIHIYKSCKLFRQNNIFHVSLCLQHQSLKINEKGPIWGLFAIKFIQMLISG